MSMKDALDNFNSTMVRLKAAYRIIMQSLEGNFNSTMVRLKENTGIAMKLTLTIFQFHYGTIKSGRSGDSGLRDEISIPLWYD